MIRYTQQITREENFMKAYERLLKYAVIKTPSDESSDSTPSSACQFDLANLLKKEMEELGVSDIQLTDNCFLYGKLPATKGYESAPAIGFIAHMDTVADYCEQPIRPIITENYNGKELALGNSGLTLSPKMFPHLESLKGHTLITTDGNTILGADDKAGIAEIMTLVEHLQKESIPHGPISIAFTPDEEIGTGASHFDVELFGADFAYTLDGSTEGELEYENFNACSASFDIHGVSVHPGSAKDTMINACLLAMEINSLLPLHETPRDTEGYEGFYHLISCEGTVEQTTLTYIIRDHDRDRFERRKKEFEHLVRKINKEFPNCASLEIKDQYYNMREMVEPVMHIVDLASQAMKEVGIVPIVKPVRGGTDGAQLSFMGLPCPNIFAGGHNFHGRYEFVPIQSMEKARDVVIQIARLAAEK